MVFVMCVFDFIMLRLDVTYTTDSIDTGYYMTSTKHGFVFIKVTCMQCFSIGPCAFVQVRLHEKRSLVA